MTTQLLLASRSPRRAELLRQLGLRFTVVEAGISEVRAPGQSPADYVRAMAAAKARAGARGARLPVLGADTDVAIDGEILGKPRDAEDCVRMLLRLSQRSHEVYSAVAVCADARFEARLSVTRVQFGRIARAQALDYWNSGEPVDKAGAYAIQGYAARWVQSIEGSYSGVVGLPLYETAELLERFEVLVSPVPSFEARAPIA